MEGEGADGRRRRGSEGKVADEDGRDHDVDGVFDPQVGGGRNSRLFPGSRAAERK